MKVRILLEVFFDLADCDRFVQCPGSFAGTVWICLNMNACMCHYFICYCLTGVVLINDWAAYESGVHHVLYIVFCNWITISIFVMQSNLYVWCHLSGVWHWETPMVLEEVAFVGSLYVSIPTHSCCIPNSLYLYVVLFLYSSLFLLSIPTYSCIDCPVSLRWWCWQTPIMFKGACADDEVSFFNTNTTPLICSSTPTYISTLFCSVLLCILINFILLNSD